MNKARRNFKWATAAAVTGLFGLVAARQLGNKPLINKPIANNKVQPTANARLGINLAGVVDWGTEFPFVDLFKQSRAWFVEGQGAANLMLDADGWVSQLPLGVAASTIISSLDNGHFLSGDDCKSQSKPTFACLGRIFKRGLEWRL